MNSFFLLKVREEKFFHNQHLTYITTGAIFLYFTLGMLKVIIWMADKVIKNVQGRMEIIRKNKKEKVNFIYLCTYVRISLN